MRLSHLTLSLQIKIHHHYHEGAHANTFSEIFFSSGYVMHFFNTSSKGNKVIYRSTAGLIYSFSPNKSVAEPIRNTHIIQKLTHYLWRINWIMPFILAFFKFLFNSHSSADYWIPVLLQISNNWVTVFFSYN